MDSRASFELTCRDWSERKDERRREGLDHGEENGEARGRGRCQINDELNEHRVPGSKLTGTEGSKSSWRDLCACVCVFKAESESELDVFWCLQAKLEHI